jgi:hypothetical protein
MAKRKNKSVAKLEMERARLYQKLKKTEDEKNTLIAFFVKEIRELTKLIIKKKVETDGKG